MRFVMDTVTRPLTYLYADDIFRAKVISSTCPKWNDRLMQHNLRLDLNKTKFLTADRNETGTITFRGSDQLTTERFKYIT